MNKRDIVFKINYQLDNQIKKKKREYSTKMFEYLFQDLMIRFEYQASFLNCQIG